MEPKPQPPHIACSALQATRYNIHTHKSRQTAAVVAQLAENCTRHAEIVSLHPSGGMVVFFLPSRKLSST